jgi:small subunit ribosomal protein S4e
MARGPKNHLKRLAAPKHWMLDKMGGVFAPRSNAGGHKLRESLPLILILRNRLKYALSAKEADLIVKQRFVKVDDKVRTDYHYPAGFMDVISIPQTNDNFRLLYDTKGRFVLHPVTSKEASYKLCRVLAKGVQKKNVPYVRTHDGRLIRYADPLLQVNDTVKIDVTTGKPLAVYKFKVGSLCMITGGANTGRVGQIIQREPHAGSFEIIHVRDATGATFTTRIGNVFVIGEGTTSEVSLPKGKGVAISVVEDRKRKLLRRKQEARGKKSAKKTTTTTEAK